MMKKILFILKVFVVLTLSAQGTLTTEQWREDLQFMQNTIHEEYPHLFVKTTKEKFDLEVQNLMKEIPNLQDHQIIVNMAKIIASFKYGHTYLGFGKKAVTFHYLPFNLYQFQEDVYLQGVYKTYKNTLGAKIIKINQIPIKEALQKIEPVVEAENDQYFKSYGINYLRIPEILHTQGITKKLETTITLTLEKDGTTFDQSFEVLIKDEKRPLKYGYIFENNDWLEARNQDTTPLYLKHLDKPYFFEYLEKQKAVYIRHSRISDDPTENMKSFYERVFDFVEKNDVQKLILDVRLNGGGNNFLNKPIITGIIETKKINKKGRFFVITGRRTFSACQNLVNELDNYTNAIFVGEPTSENVNFWGDARTIPLPNSAIPMRLSYAWWQDKPAWQNADWLAPSVPVEMSFEEYRTNQDPVLDAALSFSGMDFIPDPMVYIIELYATGKMQELSEELPKMIQDPRYDFFDFETELNTSALRLLNTGQPQQMQGAMGIFSFISQLFPDSALTHKNMATGYLKLGDTDKAKEIFKKAISLDTDGEIGKSASKILVGLD